MSQSFTNQLTNANVYQGGTAVSVSNPLYVTSGGSTNVISTGNSTTTPLAGGATFTGAWELIGGYVSVSIIVDTDSVATLGALKFDYSTDGTNVDRTVPVDITTGGDYASLGNEGKYFRVRLTAGAGAQSFLRLQTQYFGTADGLKQTPLIDSLTDSSTALVTRGLILGKTTGGGGGYVAVKVTPSGALTTAPGGASTTGTNTSVAGTTTNSTTLLASNASRLGGTIYNANTVGGGVILYVSLGTTCTPTNYTLQVAAGGYYEIPFGYTGRITGVFSAASGNALMTETT